MGDLLADLGSGLTELTALYPGRSAHRIQGVLCPPNAGNYELLLSHCELTVAGLTLSPLGGFSSELSSDVHRADINTAVETLHVVLIFAFYGGSLVGHTAFLKIFLLDPDPERISISRHANLS